MLHANRFKPKDGKALTTISGATSGRRVLCESQALPQFNNLVSLAKQGNYWAGLVVRGIQGLNSGRLSKDNIYIKKQVGLAYGKGAFYVVLPGVTAILEELPNSGYVLKHLHADTNYMQMQEASQRPGLWRVNADLDQSPDFIADGKILNKDFRPVAIPDMTVVREMRDLSKIIGEQLGEANGTIKSMVRQQGFDMHYTPGGSGIVGLKKASRAIATSRDKQITESAILLANTMYRARNIEGVLWYSDWGGSAVLTRAMQILTREKGLEALKGHSIFLNRPTSSPQQVEKLARELKITPLDKGKKTGLTRDEIRGHIIHTEIGFNKTTAMGALTTTGFGIGAASAGVGLATAALTATGVLGVAGGLWFVATALKDGAAALKRKKY